MSKLLQKYPEAGKRKDNDGRLPLHSALWYKASNKITKMILEANPDATKVKNNVGCLPLHEVLRCKASH
ncbi:MAG: ankyrin repeat domain-containing protein, partial [bacterium]